MPLRVAWGITGSGDLLPETFAVMSTLRETDDIDITAVLSQAGEKVVRWYKLRDQLDGIARRVFVEKDANTPFIVGPLQTGGFDCLLVAPATANTVAKLVYGIADTIITNAVAQTGKTDVPIFVLPVDQREGVTVTTRPGGEPLTLTIRAIDVENSRKLAAIEGIRVLPAPQEIVGALQACPRRGSQEP
jgi:archaeoflavoprotein AfpA